MSMVLTMSTWPKSCCDFSRMHGNMNYIINCTCVHVFMSSEFTNDDYIIVGSDMGRGGEELSEGTEEEMRLSVRAWEGGEPCERGGHVQGFR